MNAEWRWDFAIEILPQMLLATLNTILAAGIGYAIAAVVGLLFFFEFLIFGLMRLSKNKIIQGIATVYIEFFRGTSLLVQLFWVYYVLF